MPPLTQRTLLVTLDKRDGTSPLNICALMLKKMTKTIRLRDMLEIQTNATSYVNTVHTLHGCTVCLVFSASPKANDSEEMISNTYYLLNKAENRGAFPISAWSKD